MTDSDLDRAIDAAVRQMMDVEPPVDVKARVFDRLRRPEHRVFTWPQVAAFAAAVVLLAFVVLRLPRPAPVTDVSRVPRVPAPVASSPEVPAVSTPPSSDAVANPSSATEHRVVTTRAEGAPAVPELEAIDPITVESPRSQDIEPAEIVIVPMVAIPEVQIEPLFHGSEQH